MFFHVSDNGYVYPVVRIEIRCGMSISPSGIKIAGISRISKIAPKNSSQAELFCNACNSPVQISDVSAICMQCGELHPVTEMVGLKQEGGVYCKSCANKYFAGKETYSVSIALTKIASN